MLPDQVLRSRAHRPRITRERYGLRLLQRIEFVTADKLGFWKVRGYHKRVDPWAEQQ